MVFGATRMEARSSRHGLGIKQREIAFLSLNDSLN